MWFFCAGERWMWQSGLPRPRHQRTYWLLSLIPLHCHTFTFIFPFCLFCIVSWLYSLSLFQFVLFCIVSWLYLYNVLIALVDPIRLSYLQCLLYLSQIFTASVWYCSHFSHFTVICSIITHWVITSTCSILLFLPSIPNQFCLYAKLSILAFTFTCYNYWFLSFNNKFVFLIYFFYIVQGIDSSPWSN